MDAKVNRPFDAATTVEHSSRGDGGPRRLAIGVDVMEAVVAHLRAELPNEGCGLLATVPGEDADRVVHFFAGTNIDRSPVRYTMDPAEVIEAMKRIREEGWHLGAIVHSHPRTAPIPSRTDRREWYYPDARLMIVSFMADEPEIRCWARVGARETNERSTSSVSMTGGMEPRSLRAFLVCLFDGYRRGAAAPGRCRFGKR